MALREAIAGIYQQIGLPQEWTEQQRARFIEEECDRIEVVYSQVQATLQDHVLAEYRRTHQGRSPEYLEHVGLIRNTQLQAEEIVLAELYEQIPVEDEDDEMPDWMRPDGWWHEKLMREHSGDPDRWKTGWCSDPTNADLETIWLWWPEASEEFQFTMGELWRARKEDGLSLPSSVDEPLARQMATDVAEHLAAKHAGETTTS